MAQGESNTVDVVAEKDELILLLFNQNFDHKICRFLLPLHAISGCDTTGMVGENYKQFIS